MFGIGRMFRRSSCTVLSKRFFKPFPVVTPINLPPKESPEYLNSISKSKEVNSLHESLRQICLSGGGFKGIERHTKINKKILVRNRIKSILDENSEWLEIGLTAGIDMEYGDVPCAGTVVGIGKIRGVDVMIVANDGTVKGGTSYPITVTKSLRAQNIARINGIPCLYIVDSGGAFLPLQSEIFPDEKHGGRSFYNQAVMSSEGIHQIALVAGLCTAGAAYTPTMSEEAIIVHKIGNIYLGGPPLVFAALGEKVTGEQLGGATLHCSTSGVTDHFAQTEEESFELLKDIISSLNIEPSSFTDSNLDLPLYNELSYLAGLGRSWSKEEVKIFLGSLVDGSRFQEFKPMFGSNLTTGFGKMSGKLAGFVINHGTLTTKDALKGAQFILLCESRNLPIIFVQNGSGYPESIDAVTLKARSSFVSVQSRAYVPKITLNANGSHGDENFFMCGPGFDPRFYFTWPSADLIGTFLPLEEPLKPRKKPATYLPGTAQYSTSRMLNDGIILPSETRNIISRCLQLVNIKQFSKKYQNEGVLRL